MADTIDGINVKLSVNSDEFVTQMKQCESSVDKAEKELGTLEGTTKSVSKEQKKFGDNVEKATESLKKHSSQTEEATSKTKSLTDESKKMSDEFNGAKTALDNLNKVLGLFGASIGIGLLIKQVEELANMAITAQNEYDKLYDKIYYMAGGLTDEQKAVANELERTYGTDYTDAIANAVGGLSTYFPNASSEQIKEISAELVAFQKKGIGDTETLVNQLNSVVKKYGLSIDEINGLLEYLLNTSMDTNASVSWLLSTLADADEFSNKVLNGDIKKTIDFFGDSSWGGEADAVSGIGSRFETAYNQMVSKYTLEYINGGFSQSAATKKASEKVSELFNQTMIDASKAATQSEASIIWANFLGEQVSKTSNIFADISMANGVKGVSYSSRNSGLSMTERLDISKNTKDYEDDISAIRDAELASIKWTKEWREESAKIEAEYAEDFDSFVGWLAGRYNDLSNIVNNFTYFGFFSGKSKALQESLDNSFIFNQLKDPFGFATGTPTFDYDEMNKYISRIFGIGTASAAEVKFTNLSELDDLSGLDSSSDISDDISNGISELTDSSDTIEEFTEDYLIPMNDVLTTTSDTLTLINENSVIYNEQTYGIVIPAIQDETTSTNNLAAAWWEAYRAKLAYQSL